MFNKTERLYIKFGRDERWGGREGKGFTFSRKKLGGKPIVGGNLISKENREAAARAAK